MNPTDFEILLHKHLALDWTQTVAFLDGSGSLFIDEFRQAGDDHIFPREYLEFAEEDLLQRSRRGNVNSVTNAKRAIDSQMALFLDAIYCGGDKAVIKANQKDFLRVRGYGCKCRRGETFEMKLLEALGVMPTQLACEARTLRHSLEHENLVPSRRESEKAFEIATLVLGQVGSVASHFASCIYLTNISQITLHDDEELDVSTCVRVLFQSGVITLSSSADEPISITASHVPYLHLIRFLCKLGIGGSAVSPLVDFLAASHITANASDVTIQHELC
jgi:hypothetical protein